MESEANWLVHIRRKEGIYSNQSKQDDFRGIVSQQLGWQKNVYYKKQT